MKAKLFHKNYSYLLILISLLLNTALFSCKMKSEQYSFSNKLELIDALISQNYFSDAVDELKKLEKQTSDSWSFISIYKRYKYIDEQKRADLIIKKALKELPKNPELISLYSMSLLEQNNLDEAIKTSKALIGTKYASIYSQAILQKAISEPENNLFTNQEYFSIYYDAYQTSQNPIWIKNCAVIALLQGNYAKATEIAPTSFANSNDAYFWATILYDGIKFIESLDALSQAKTLNQNLSTKNSSFLINLSALESDCYMAISDMQQAEQTRQKLLLDVDSFNINQKENKHLPIIYVNSAIWAINNGMQEKARELLSHAVNTWEDFVPALIAYADFAYNSSIERTEDEHTQALRQAGLKTIDMEKYDNRSVIPVSDALYRIEKSLKNQYSPELVIKQLDLKYKTNQTLSQKQKISDLWMMIEDNLSQDSVYEEMLVQYAVTNLIKNSQIQDAFTLFQNFLYKTYSLDEKEEFWHQVQSLLPLIQPKTAEIAAYFATTFEKRDEAIRLSEYCVYESAGILQEGFISSKVSTATCMNLADIYYSTGKKEKALDLYGKAASRESNASLRSEIFYRIACIYVTMNDNLNALRSADYATTIYPDNVKAQLLKNKLKTN